MKEMMRWAGCPSLDAAQDARICVDQDVLREAFEG
jgi:hypothetical protein